MSRLLPLSLLFISLVIFTACNAPDKSAEWQTMTLYGTNGIIVGVNDGDGTNEHGEQTFFDFEARLNERTGKLVGKIIGMTVICDLPGDDGVGNPEIEERFATLAIIFEDGDEIMSTAAFEFPANEVKLKNNNPQLRTIIGGTGKYKGIRGQMEVTRNADETYLYTIEYKVD